jgi:hypothetical protein
LQQQHDVNSFWADTALLTVLATVPFCAFVCGTVPLDRSSSFHQLLCVLCCVRVGQCLLDCYLRRMLAPGLVAGSQLQLPAAGVCLHVYCVLGRLLGQMPELVALLVAVYLVACAALTAFTRQMPAPCLLLCTVLFVFSLA